MPAATWEQAAAAAARADVVLVVGTSGLVNPAATLATRYPSAAAFVIEVNPEATPISRRADASLRGSAAAVLPELIETVAPAPGSQAER